MSYEPGFDWSSVLPKVICVKFIVFTTSSFVEVGGVFKILPSGFA